jgi:hypothetical protein
VKRRHCVYLYSDGHAVVVFEKNDRELGRVQYVEIVQQWTKASCNFTGRIVLGRMHSEGLADWMREADIITIKAPTFDAGSEATRDRGIPVGSLDLHFPKRGSLYWTVMPSIISAPYTYQPDNVETFDPTLTEWSGMHVARVQLARVPAPESVGAI